MVRLSVRCPVRQLIGRWAEARRRLGVGPSGDAKRGSSSPPVIGQRSTSFVQWSVQAGLVARLQETQSTLLYRTVQAGFTYSTLAFALDGVSAWSDVFDALLSLG